MQNLVGSAVIATKRIKFLNVSAELSIKKTSKKFWYETNFKNFVKLVL